MRKVLALLFLFSCVESRSEHSSSTANPQGSYYVQGNTVYYGDQAIPGADAATFQILGSYAKDARKVFWGLAEVAGADAESFEALEIFYGRDKTHAFYLGQELPGFDGSTFEVLERGFLLRDRTHATFWGIDFPGADPATLERKVTNWDFYIFADQSKVFCFDTQQRKFASLAMTSTLTISRVFPRGKSNESADFYTNGVDVFLKNCTLVPGADARRFFELANFTAYYGDKKSQVYFYGTPLPNADALTFEAYEGNFAKDASRVFYQEKEIPTADAATFKVVCRYSESAQNPNWLTTPVDYCGGPVGRDKNRVFDPNDSATWARSNP